MNDMNVTRCVIYVYSIFFYSIALGAIVIVMCENTVILNILFFVYFFFPVANSMQYGQNISLPYPQQQNDHSNMFANDHKDNILKAKMDRERDDGNFHQQNFSSHTNSNQYLT